jgi:hypothetical protein
VLITLEDGLPHLRANNNNKRDAHPIGLHLVLGVSESHLLSAIASCNNILHSKSPTVHSAVVLISHDHNTVTTPNMNSSSCVEKSAARTRHDSWDRARGALSDDGYANIIPNQNAYAKRCHPVRR